MTRKSSRALGALAAVTVAAGMLVAGAVPAGARLAVKHAHAVPAVKHFSAAGTYDASVPAAHMDSQLVITEGPEAPNSGTFVFTDIGDYGNWIMQGRTISMMIVSSEQDHAGIVLIGHVTHDGINGWVGVPRFGQITWEATRNDAPSGAATRVASAMKTLAAADQQPPGTAPGTYDVQFPQGPTFSDTLVLTPERYSSRAGQFSLVNLADTGNWVQMGRHLAIGISQGADAGVTMIGTRTASGFDSAEKPGKYFAPTSGIFDWYATKTD
jgi:hypothetical protein